MTYTRARILTRLWPVASLAGLMGGCGEQTPTEVISENRINGPRYIEYSSGFYPSGDGYYFWDGQAPSGDFAPAIIQNAKAGGMAPRPGTEGWVEGEMETDGDQYKMDLVFSVDHNGQAVFSNSTFSSNWKWGSMEPRQGDARLLTYYKYDRSLNVQGDIDQRCDYTLENGGTAYARKAVPFGI